MSSPPPRLHGAVRRRRLGARAAPVEPPKPPPNPPEPPAAGAACSPATIAGEESCIADEDRHVGVASERKTFSSPPTLPTCRTEPDKGLLCEDFGTKVEERLGASSQVRNRGSAETQKLLERSKVPFVRLERLRVPPVSSRLLVSQVLAEGKKHNGPHLDPVLPPVDAVSPEPARSNTSLTHQRKTMMKISLPFVSLHRILQVKSSKSPTVCSPSAPGAKNTEQGLPRPSHNPPGVQSNPKRDLSLPPASCNLEPDLDSIPVSESLSHLEFKSNLKSEPNLDLESDPSAHSESQPETDSLSESEQQPESKLFLGSGQESEPEADSEQDSEPQPVSDSYWESEPDQELELDLDHQSDQEPGATVACVEMPRPCNSAECVQGGGPRAGAIQMENDDFCAVCLNGGDLLCCDHCPKVFHLSCHIPALLSFPAGDWLCSLCRDVLQPELEYDCENTRVCGEHALKGVAYGLSPCDQRRCEKLTLFVSCNILSTPFHEPVSPLAQHYYQIIKRPMDLSVIRSKLNMMNPLQYCTPEDYVADICLMFNNCAKFNYPDSEVAQAGRSLEVFFQSKLREVFPSKTFLPANDSNSESEDYKKYYRPGVDGLSWPSQKEHCYRKRKRRRALNWKRHHF